MQHVVAANRLLAVFALTVVASVVAPGAAAVYDWNVDANGNWSDSGNWTSVDDPGNFPNSSTADARFLLGLSAYRTATLTEDIVVNAIRFQDTNGNNDNFIISQGGGPYTITFSGTTPTIESLTGANRGLDIQAHVDISAGGLTKIGSGVARLDQGMTGDAGDTLTLSQGSIELRRDSPDFYGDIVVESGARLQARSVVGTGATVLGDTGGGTTINGTGWFETRDSNNLTISENFVLNGIRTGGTLRCYAGGSNTFDGTVTLNSDSSYSVADWSNNGIGNARIFYINNTINDGAGGPHSVYFLGDLAASSARGVKGRFSEMVVGGTFNYGGTTYVTSSFADDGTETFMGNLRLAGDNILPTGTTLVLGGSHSTTGGTLGTSAGSGKFALAGHNQELAGLTTNGTGSLNMVVGASTTLSTLTLNIASGTNTYDGYLGYADFVSPTDSNDPLYGAPSELNRNNLALVKTGAGTLTLTKNNTYSGGTTVSDGILEITSPGALGTGAVTVQSGADVRFNAPGVYSVANPLTLAGSGDSGHGAITSTNPGTNVTLTGAITLTGQTVIKAWGDSTTWITLAGGVDGTAGNHGLTLFRDGGRIVVDTNPVQLGTGSLGGGFDLNVAGNTAGRLFSQWNQPVNIGADNPFVTPPAVELGNDSGANGYRGYLNLQGHTFTASSLAETTTNAAGASEVRDTVGGGNFILDNASGQTSTYTGRFTGNLSLTKNGAGTLTLSGNSDYTGATSLNQGVLRVQSDNALGSPSSGTTVDTTDSRLDLAGDVTIAEPITLTGGAISATSLQSVSGTNTLTGLLTISNARIRANTGSTLNITGGVTGSNPLFVVNSANGTINFTTNPLDLGNGTFWVDSGGLTVLAVAGNTWGDTTFTSGTLRMGAANALPANSSFRHSGLSYGTGGTLDLNGFDQTIGSLATGSNLANAAGSQITSAAPATLTVNQDNNTTFSGAFTGAVSLVKDGTGTLTLAGDNTHIGVTVVNGGVLALQTAGTSNIPDSTELVVGDSAAHGGAIFDVTGVAGGFELTAVQTLSGFGTVRGDLTVLGTHGPGASTGVQTIQGNYTNNGVPEIEIGGPCAGNGYDQVLVAGPTNYDVTLGGTLDLLFGGSGWSSPQNNLWIINNQTDGDLIGAFTNFPDNGAPVASYDGRTWYLYYGADFNTKAFAGGNDVLLTAVPEPSTLAMLLGLAGLGLLGCSRRRR